MLNIIIEYFFVTIIVIAIIGFVGFVIDYIIRAVRNAIEIDKYGPIKYYHVQFYGDIKFMPFQAHSPEELFKSLFNYFDTIDKGFNIYEVPYADCTDVSKWKYVCAYEEEKGCERENEFN